MGRPRSKTSVAIIAATRFPRHTRTRDLGECNLHLNQRAIATAETQWRRRPDPHAGSQRTPCATDTRRRDLDSGPARCPERHIARDETEEQTQVIDWLGDRRWPIGRTNPSSSKVRLLKPLFIAMSKRGLPGHRIFDLSFFLQVLFRHPVYVRCVWHLRSRRGLLASGFTLKKTLRSER